MGKSTGPLVLIDGHNAFIRNYVRSPYTDSHGERMGGATGMVVSVRKIINDFQASNCLVVWDGQGGSQRRKSILSSYKAGRTVRLNEREENDFGETPEQRMENMRRQRNVAQDYLTMLGVPQVRADGVEADDLIAYLAGKMNHPGGCVIVTTDQDMLQLVREASGGCSEENHADGCSERCTPRVSEVRVYSPVKAKMYDREAFISEYAVLPENFRLVKALTGDKSDNIEGIRGFGVRTVVKLFPELAQKLCGPATITDKIDHELSPTLGKRLAAEKSRFLENLTLVDLSAPMLSATAARQGREALRLDLGCKEVEFRVRIVRDGVAFKGDGFVNVFREFVHRRRRVLAETKAADPVDTGEAAGTGGLPEGETPPAES